MSAALLDAEPLLEDAELTKVCSKCGIEKPLSEFKKHKAYRLGVLCWCRPCWRIEHNKAQNKYNKSPKGQASIANSKFQSRYGMTREDVADMAREQGGCCPICGDNPYNMHIDHDHATGVVRGLLCGPCNLALGQFADDPTRMANAIDYLTRGQ